MALRNVKRGMLALVLSTSIVVGSLPSAPPANALACPPASSLCSPAGLALIAEGEVVGLGTATAGAGASTTTAIAATATPVSGVGGFSFGGIVGPALNVAAALTVSGWAAGWLDVGGSGTVGLDQSAPQPGWMTGPTFRFSGWAWDSSAHYSDGVARVTVVSAPAYGEKKSSNSQFTIRYDLAGRCDASVARHTYLAFPAPVVRGVWVRANGYKEYGSALDPSNWSGKCSVSSKEWTGGASGSVSASSTFSHLEVSLGGRDFTALTVGETVPGVTRGVWLPGWFPNGHPQRTSEPAPGDGLVKRYIKCIGATGAITEITDTVNVNIGAAAHVATDPLVCPEGSVAAGFGADWLPGGDVGAAESMIPWTETYGWVQDIPIKYPACLEQTCWLQLFERATVGPPVSCGSGAIECPDWYVIPTRDADYLCQWGPYEVDLSYCAVFRDPGNLLPNVFTDADGTSSREEWPLLELDSGVVANLRDALQTRYDGRDGACDALGETLRETRATASLVTVPDVTLMCHANGLAAGLNWINSADAVGHEQALAALVAAAYGPRVMEVNPDCDELTSTGECLEWGSDFSEYSPDLEPEPAPAGAGGQVPPRDNCLSPAQRDALIASMPVQGHHVATKYGSFAKEYLETITSFDLDLDLIDAAGVWNVVPIPHRGPHPVEYHDWVMENFRNAAESAGDGNTQGFLILFEAWVVDKIKADPTIVRTAYWKCYR